ncbi:MAG: SDR family oxidoreductase [Chloroflexota bacterium]
MKDILSVDWREKYGQWAIVTGASSGIGRAIAEELASAGLHLILVARRRHLLETLASELSQKHSIETCVLDLDLAQRDGVQHVINATANMDVGLLVASAGFGTSGQFVDSTLESEMTMLAVNCGTVLELSHAFGKRFSEQKRGGIILLSSLVAFQGVPMSAHYAATKAYVQSLAEGLHLELASYGVDVLAVAPGPVASGFAEQADMQMGATVTPEAVAKGTLNALGKKITVRPGWLSLALESALALLPRWARARIMGQVMSGMTAHQNA